MKTKKMKTTEDLIKISEELLFILFKKTDTIAEQKYVLNTLKEYGVGWLENKQYFLFKYETQKVTGHD